MVSDGPKKCHRNENRLKSEALDETTAIAPDHDGAVSFLVLVVDLDLNAFILHSALTGCFTSRRDENTANGHSILYVENLL